MGGKTTEETLCKERKRERRAPENHVQVEKTRTITLFMNFEYALQSNSTPSLCVHLPRSTTRLLHINPEQPFPATPTPKLPCPRLILFHPPLDQITSTTMSQPTKSPFSNRMGWGRHPALLIIDVCTAYFTPGSPLDTSSNPASAASPESMRRLLAAARKGKCPVVFTKVEYGHPHMKDAGLFWSKTKALDVWKVGDGRGLDESVEGLEPIVVDVGGDEWVVKKKYPSAFFGTTLATDLYLKGVDTVVVCGVSTSGCVRATVLDAMCHGFRPMVVGSACGDRTKEVHEANMFDMGKFKRFYELVLGGLLYSPEKQVDRIPINASSLSTQKHEY